MIIDDFSWFLPKYPRSEVSKILGLFDSESLRLWCNHDCGGDGYDGDVDRGAGHLYIDPYMMGKTPIDRTGISKNFFHEITTKKTSNPMDLDWDK